MATAGRPKNPFGRSSSRGGRPRKRPEFVLKPGVPHPPPFIEADKLAFAEWIRVCELMDKDKRISPLFLASVAMYCMKWSDWVQIREKIQDDGLGMTMLGSNGSKRVVRNPWLSTEVSVFKDLMKAAAEIGITPLTSMKVDAIPSPPREEGESHKSAEERSLSSFIEELA